MPIICLILSLFISACSPASSPSQSSASIMDYELELKQALLVIKKQEGRYTSYELALPGLKPWPTVEQYLDKELAPLPLNFSVVGLLEKGQRLSLGKIEKKSSWLFPTQLRYYSQLTTQQGEVWVVLDLVMGSLVFAESLEKLKHYRETRYVKLLKK